MADQVWQSPSWPTTMEKTDEEGDNTQQKLPSQPTAYYRSTAKRPLSRKPTFPALGREDYLMLDKIGSQQQYAGKTKETAFLNRTFKWNHGVLKTTFPQEIIGTEKDNAQWTGKRVPSILKTARTFDSTKQKKNTKSVSFAVLESSDEEAYDYSEDDTDSDYTNSDLDDSASPSEIEEIEDAIKVKSLIKWLIKVVFAGLLLGCIVYYGVSYYFHVEEIVDNSYWGCFKRAILPQEKVVDTFWGSVKRVIFQQQQVVDNTFWGSFKRCLSRFW
ncbi:hypothetical protein LOTGIDRAFT_155845 [Lottia gigantea]|uniref:Uncharacterized protein n=1 Tax=Lottia gigantea TaxID=225164 RepID=V3YXK6_LOTGI|nr:hypothetical protein LOTGIDRAFT_155845 [Lottia gigantea]ESO82813.1 hypothetical protein LOTGIDRAFT_155845 [Lottia gigantea]